MVKKKKENKRELFFSDLHGKKIKLKKKKKKKKELQLSYITDVFFFSLELPVFQ